MCTCLTVLLAWSWLKTWPRQLLHLALKGFLLPAAAVVSLTLGSYQPIKLRNPNASLTEPAQRLGPLQLTSPLACVMQTVADSLEF